MCFLVAASSNRKECLKNTLDNIFDWTFVNRAQIAELETYSTYNVFHYKTDSNKTMVAEGGKLLMSDHDKFD